MGGWSTTSLRNSGENLDLGKVTDRAIAATVEVQSYRAMEVVIYTIDGETVESKHESECVAPDRFYEKLTSDGNWSEAMSIGD
jgi:hypothetical protein